nr:putative distant relative of cell wall-associated hydrolases [Virgibacillus halodenitrificans]
MNLKVIEESELQPGDVLLCYSPDLEGKNEYVKDGYSHVAICVSGRDIVEANSAGVALTNTSNLLDEYGHIAVLRNPELWSPGRLNKLNGFARSKLGKKFNKPGMLRVPQRKEEQEVEAMDRVEGYFEGTYSPAGGNRNVYFCSELVTSAFIEVGIIDESASIVLSPEIFSPEDIGKDKAFGFFVGYIKPHEDYQIPHNDYFRTSI